VNLATLAARNLTRNRTRIILTILGVAVMVLGFLTIRTVVWAWSVAAEVAAKDRLVTRHKVTFILSLPKRYAEDVAKVDGIQVATYANWFGGKDPNDEQNFFANMAVDEKTFLDVYTEIQAPPDQVAAWKGDPQGVLIGENLAKRMKLELGSRVTLVGTIFPGDWVFTVRGIYHSTSKAVDNSQFFFHWDYLNNALPDNRKDQIGWVVARTKDATRAADFGAQIDKMFDERDIQTITQDEKSFNNSFLAMFSATLTALDIGSLMILLIMGLILGNTIAMGVRERTFEYGVMRALGFQPSAVFFVIVVEAVFIGLAGGLAGLALAYPLVEGGVGRFLEENMGGYFPYFRIPALTAALAVGLSTGLGALAALIPARGAARLTVTNALRRVG
jgi:putative ABC transport system permease protein